MSNRVLSPARWAMMLGLLLLSPGLASADAPKPSTALALRKAKREAIAAYQSKLAVHAEKIVRGAESKARWTCRRGDASACEAARAKIAQNREATKRLCNTLRHPQFHLRRMVVTPYKGQGATVWKTAMDAARPAAIRLKNLRRFCVEKRAHLGSDRVALRIRTDVLSARSELKTFLPPGRKPPSR